MIVGEFTVIIEVEITVFIVGEVAAFGAEKLHIYVEEAGSCVHWDETYTLGIEGAAASALAIVFRLLVGELDLEECLARRVVGDKRLQHTGAVALATELVANGEVIEEYDVGAIDGNCEAEEFSILLKIPHVSCTAFFHLQYHRDGLFFTDRKGTIVESKEPHIFKYVVWFVEVHFVFFLVLL